MRFLFDESPFYRKRHGDKLCRVETKEDFRALETLTKSELLDHLWEIRSTREFPLHFGLSGGTTSEAYGGKLALYAHGRDEVEFNRRLMWRQVLPHPRPLAVKIIHPHHGAPYYDCLPGTFMMPLESEYHFAQLKTLLQSTLEFKDCEERVSILVAPSNYIKLLFSLCAREGVLESLALRRAYGGGDRLTPRWRRLIESRLGAETVESYGVSEVVHSAAQACASCGRYHFHETVYPEFLPLEAEGNGRFGEIVLTSLLPATVTLPLLRYRTGDIALRPERCDATGKDSYRVLGRLAQSYYRQEPFGCIPSGVVEDIVDDLPWVARRCFQAGVAFGLGTEIGLPEFRFEPPDGGPASLVLNSTLPAPFLHSRTLDADCAGVQRALTDAAKKGLAALPGEGLQVHAAHW